MLPSSDVDVRGDVVEDVRGLRRVFVVGIFRLKAWRRGVVRRVRWRRGIRRVLRYIS